MWMDWNIIRIAGLVLVKGYVATVVPKGVQGVYVASFLVENVHDNIAVVHADPSAFACAFVANGKFAEFFHFRFLMVEKSLYLGCGTTGAYNKIVGDIRHACDFHNFDVQSGFCRKDFADVENCLICDVLHRDFS